MHHSMEIMIVGLDHVAVIFHYSLFFKRTLITYDLFMHIIVCSWCSDSLSESDWAGSLWSLVKTFLTRQRSPAVACSPVNFP